MKTPNRPLRSRLGTTILALFAGCVAPRGAQAQRSPTDGTPRPAGFEYKSAGFSCRIQPDGTLQDVRIPDALIAKSMFLHAIYKAEEPHDARLFQHNLSESAPLRTVQNGSDSVLAFKEGVLRSDKFERAARFSQRVALSPARLEIAYEIEMLESLATQGNRLFLVLHEVPCETLAGRGYRLGSRLQVFPATYAKVSAVSARGRELAVVLDRVYFSFLTEPGTAFSITDCRSWGGEGYRIDVAPEGSWTPALVRHVRGTRFRCAYSISCTAFR